MSRFWIALALLAALLGLGLLTTGAMDSTCGTLAQLLEQATEGDWDQAEQLVGQAKGLWQRHRNAIATVSSHEPMEEIDALLSQLELYLQQREAMGFRLCCRGLICRIKAMGEAQAVNWWSLL